MINFLRLVWRRLEALYRLAKAKGLQPWMLLLSALRLLIELVWK